MRTLSFIFFLSLLVTKSFADEVPVRSTRLCEHLADTTKPFDTLFEKVELEAAFPGGTAAWKKFLMTNLNGMVPTDNGAPVGKYTVIVQFLVDKNGVITDIKVLTAHGFGMEKEVVKVLQRSPNWEPAIYNGRQVKAYRKLPVIFTVANE